MHTTSEFLRVERCESVASIVMDRPERRNAFNSAMWNALTTICNELAVDTSVKAVVIRSSNSDAFCAGADISEFAELARHAEAVEANAKSIRESAQALKTLPRPTIARIQGSCFGGGALLALACDFRIADTSASFAITPARLGLCYSISDTSNLVNTVGLSVARRMLLLAEVLDADAALQCGLVDRVTAIDSIDAELEQMLSTLHQLSQYSLRNLKAGLERVCHGQTEDDAESIARFTEAFLGEDLAEGMDAFLSRRKPRFPFNQ